MAYRLDNWYVVGKSFCPNVVVHFLMSAWELMMNVCNGSQKSKDLVLYHGVSKNGVCAIFLICFDGAIINSIS